MTTAPTTTLSRADLDLIERVHGHICPMVLLGARTARKARLEMGEGSTAHLFAFYRGHGCGVDGVQIFSGCTWGNGNLVLLRGRDHSLLLTAEEAGEGVLVSPRREVLARIRRAESGDRQALMEWLAGEPDGGLCLSEKVAGLGVLSRFPEE
ncbi:MAG: hypothetical protein JSV00_07100 [bacterium]|nr:MAG: hypothetical protein JSV00_07100 [bacterium]